MLLNMSHFEQHFSEGTLRAALKLLTKGPVEMLERRGKTEYRLALGANEITLKLRGEKLLSGECTCRGVRLCEHAAAALFYLNRERLGYEEWNGVKPKFNRTFEKHLPAKKIKPDEILAIAENKIKSGRLRKQFESLPGEAALQNYIIVLRQMIGKFQDKDKPNYEDSLQAFEKFRSAFAGFSTHGGSVYAMLALLVVLQEIYSLTLIERFKLIEVNITKQLKAKIVGLKTSERRAWEAATLLCMRNSRVFRQGGWRHLLPPMLVWLRQRHLFGELRVLFLKRKNERPFYQKIDWFTVAKLQLDIQESTVFGTEVPARDLSKEFEFLLAETELAFNQGKPAKAFSRLKKAYAHVCEYRKECFEELAEYGFEKANEHKNNTPKLFFLEERIKKSLFLSGDLFNEWKKMLPVKVRAKAYDRLISGLRHPSYYTFEKLSLVLLYTGKIKELIEEIKKNEFTFLLLHGVALNYVPEPDDDFLLLYAKRLANALARLRLYSGQTELFGVAAVYLKGLPATAVDMVVNHVTTHLGSESNIAKYIRHTSQNFH